MDTTVWVEGLAGGEPEGEHEGKDGRSDGDDDDHHLVLDGNVG